MLYAHYTFQVKGERESEKAWIQWLKYGEHNGDFVFLYAYKHVDPRVPAEFKEAAQRALEERQRFKSRWPTIGAALYGK